MKVSRKFLVVMGLLLSTSANAETLKVKVDWKINNEFDYHFFVPETPSSTNGLRVGIPFESLAYTTTLFGPSRSVSANLFFDKYGYVEDLSGGDGAKYGTGPLFIWSSDGVPVMKRGVFDIRVWDDDVRITIGAVPETSTWAMMLVGFGAIGGLIRSRKKLLSKHERTIGFNT